MADRQIFIIGDAEFLVPQEASPEAANALLKLLEEPPGETRFILTSSEPGRLLPTIRSRTVPLHLAPLSDDEVGAFLSGHGDTDPETAARVTALAQGSIGRALGFLPDGDEQGSLEEFRQRAYRILQAALADDLAPGFATALAYSPAGARSLVELFGALEEWLRDLAAVAAGAEEKVLSRDKLEPLRGMVRDARLRAADVTLAMPALEDARELSRGNVNPQLVIADTVRRIRRALRTGTRETMGVDG